LTSAASAQYNNVVNRVYDSASRITNETLTVGATPYNIGYSYDADNRQTHVTYPDGSVVARTFTDRNQLDVVTFNNALVANFNYDNAGRKVAANFGNGITETRTYQADNLNTSINTPGVTSFAYTWDANKRKLSQTETGIPTNNQVYTYDDEDRLTGFNRNNGDNQTWNLSLVGDWNQFNNNGNIESRTHNAVHEITTVDATPLVHDLKGNLTTNKNGQVYAWDIENRLTTATVPAGCADGVTGTHSYTYDALGRRVSKTVGGNTTVFINDGMQEIAEYINGTFSQSYVYGSYIDEPLAKYTSGTNPPLYYHASNLYSIAALTDNAGNVVERYRYDPYGKATILAPDGVTVRPNSLYGNDITWEGRRTDRETNLMYFRQRMYSLDLGIFISRFYKMDVDTHFYRFQFNAPTNYVDPWGDPWHHPYPLYLGGDDGQELLSLSDDAHAKIHKYFKDNGFPKETPNESGVRWKELTAEERDDHIRKSLEAAGLDEDTINKNLNSWKADSIPGKNRTKERGTKNKMGKNRKFAKWGTILMLTILLNDLAEGGECCNMEVIKPIYNRMRSNIETQDYLQLENDYNEFIGELRKCNIDIHPFVQMGGSTAFIKAAKEAAAQRK
jgi:RHS repeat-associated protein